MMSRPTSLAERIRQWDDFTESYTRWAQGCPAETVDTLAALANGQPSIELGAGAGRVCIPLASRNIPVTAVEFSSQMIERMRQAARRAAISNLQIVQGDFSRLPAENRYRLAYCVDNAVFALCSEEEQLRCFQCVAGLLEADGCFVVEAGAPPPEILETGARIVNVDPNCTVVERFVSDGASTISLVAEITTGITSGLKPAAKFWTLAHHYVPASKFDDYAAGAKMQLVARWSDWNRTPHDGNPWRHISVWRLAL